MRKTKTDYDIMRRCAWELARVFTDHLDCSRRCGFTANQVNAWWYEEAIPRAASLYILHCYGVDVLYIITGERNPKLYPGGDT